MTRSMVLKDCCLYDPVNGVAGEHVDICIRDGRVVEREAGQTEVIDVGGRLVMPGGVDIHSHIMGSKLVHARAMCPEDQRLHTQAMTGTTRSGTGHTLPNSFAIGYRYSVMGYTTVVEPAVPPVRALGCWDEFRDVPNIDSALLAMLSNSTITMHYVEQGDISGLAGYIAWTLRVAGTFGVKVVNPGGVYAWAHGENVTRLDSPVPDWDVTPREILRSMCMAVGELNLPHPLHVHPINLGRVGNVETTIATLDALKGISTRTRGGSAAHLAHMSFECLSSVEGGGTEWRDIASGGTVFARYMNRNRHFTVDLGQVTFGPVTTLTGDGPFEAELFRTVHTKWSNLPVDSELPGGGGVVPLRFSPKSLTHSVQWATPLEFALSIDDIWRCVLTTDSPNGGPFTKYPLVISWLMSRRQREAWLDAVHEKTSRRTALASIDREWSLYDVAVATRAAPAKILGVSKWKGHLGPGADADVAVYDLRPEEVDLAHNPTLVLRALSRTYLTIKGGEVVAREGRAIKSVGGRLWTCHVELDSELAGRVESEMEEEFIPRWYAHAPENYAVPDRYRTGIERAVHREAMDIRP